MIERKYDEASWPNARWYTVFVWKESVKPQNIDNNGKKNELFFCFTNFSRWTQQYFLCWIQIYKQNFLSGRVSKIQRNLNVQNSPLRAHETGRTFSLKCRGLWLSPVFGVRYIPLQCPAIVCQHTWGPLA